MMETEKIATNAAINALTNQRKFFADESVNLAVQVALCNAKIKELMAELEKAKKSKKPKPKTDTDTPQ